MLTDAPFPYDSVAKADIFVVRVDAKLSASNGLDAADTTSPGNNTDPRKGWVTLATPNATVDLVALEHGLVTNLGQATLPTGSYSGFRMIIDAAKSSLTLTNGTVLTGASRPGIMWPSAGETGIKIDLSEPIHLVASGTVMVIDFNLGASFVLRGRSISQNGLLFKPVVRGTARSITGSASGSVHGDSAKGAAIVAATVQVLRSGTALADTSADSVVATTSTDSMGSFMFPYLLPATYELRAYPPTGAPYNPALLSPVTVTTGADASGNDIVLPHQ
jgi:hypothetical protein